jgi:hypothetical protein
LGRDVLETAPKGNKDLTLILLFVIMGILLEWFVKDPVKKSILEWAKSLILVLTFIIVVNYYVSGSTYMQGFNDCKEQVQKQIKMFPEGNKSWEEFQYLINDTDFLNITKIIGNKTEEKPN